MVIFRNDVKSTLGLLYLTIVFLLSTLRRLQTIPERRGLRLHISQRMGCGYWSRGCQSAASIQESRLDYEKDQTRNITRCWYVTTGNDMLSSKLAHRLFSAFPNSWLMMHVAFGPPGRLNDRGVSSGDTNVSVIVSPVMKGFSLRGTLGEPTAAAEQLLSTSLAPPNSGRTATLLDAIEDSSRGVYQFEYEVDRGERGPPLRAISVIAEQHGDTLLTMTVVAPKMDWENASYQAKLRTIARSFHLL